MVGRFLVTETKYKFIERRMLAFVLSAALIAVSAVSLATRGLNFGIDFVGGVLVDVETPVEPDINQIRGVVSELGLGPVEVQRAVDSQRPNAVLIRVRAQGGGGEAAERAQQAARAEVEDALIGLYPGLDLSGARIDVVGPKVSEELVWAGVTAVVSALILMLIYILFRFDWQFSVGAVAALVHDVFITLGVFSFFQIEFGLPIVAALLTIVGYSMNDTVVVFDRVREELRRYKRMPLNDLLNMSINRTLARTIMTSVTTLLALVPLFLFAGETLRGFSFAMIFGVIIGTYSSVFVAAPVLMLLGVKRDSGETADLPAAS